LKIHREFSLHFSYKVRLTFYCWKICQPSIIFPVTSRIFWKFGEKWGFSAPMLLLENCQFPFP
jgi:hypothetical protein